MVLRLMAIPAALVIGLFSGTTAKDDGTTREPETIIVKMVDKSATEYAFEPADITVRRGDIVRLLQVSPLLRARIAVTCSPQTAEGAEMKQHY